MANATVTPPPPATSETPAAPAADTAAMEPSRVARIGDAVPAALSGALSWLKEKAVLPKKAEARVEPESAPAPTLAPSPSRAPDPAPNPGPASSAFAADDDKDDFEPVPDFVIRPGSSLRAQLPALIEPKADRRMGYILAGAIALLLLAALGILLFHDVLAAQLPSQWRTILQFDTALAAPSHDIAPAS